MKKTINFLTLTVFVLTIQFYASESQATLAQINVDGNASDEFLNQGKKQKEKVKI